MKTAQRVTAIIEREDDGFVALCPELDVASAKALRFKKRESISSKH